MFYKFFLLSVAIAQLFVVIHIFRADHERRKKQATFEFVNSASDRYKRALDEFNRKHGIDKVIDFSEYDDGDKLTVRSYLSEIERICAGINTGVFDFEILKRMMSTRLVRDFHRFNQYIADARTRGPSYYTEFERVVLAIQSEKAPSDSREGRIELS